MTKHRQVADYQGEAAGRLLYNLPCELEPPAHRYSESVAMGWNLGPYVTWGEILHLRRNLVHGRVYLAHCRTPLWFSLTGNGGAGIVGRHLRFVPRQPRRAAWPKDAWRLSPQQMGVLARCEYEEHTHTGKRTRPPAELRLEWFGPDGLVRLLLEDPQIEFVEALPESEWWTGEAEEHVLGCGQPVTEARAADPFFASWLPDFAFDDELFEDGTPFGLGDADDGAWPAELLTDLMRPKLVLRPAAALDDVPLKRILFLTLARLARYGVALEMCAHFSPRDAYRALAERLLPELEVTPSELDQGWAHPLSTTTFCPHCAREWCLDADEFPP